MSHLHGQASQVRQVWQQVAELATGILRTPHDKAHTHTTSSSLFSSTFLLREFACIIRCDTHMLLIIRKVNHISLDGVGATW